MSRIQTTRGEVDLSEEQNDKLKQLWVLVLELLNNGNISDAGPGCTSKLTENFQQKAALGRSELKALREDLNNVSANDLFVYLLSSSKQESPDRLLLRCLKTRKWDVGKSFVLFIHTLVWRNKHINMDEMIVANTELKALRESRDMSDPQRAKLSHGFLEQLRSGKVFIHGTDRMGRPILVLQGRLHRSTEKNEVLTRGILHMIEAVKLLIVPPVEGVTCVFDMTGFSVSNMEYAAAKFLIECSQEGYPELLGTMLIHNAPWAFSGIWKTMKRWIEPEIASRIHFTYTTADIENLIAPEHLVKSLNGKEDWEFQYVEPVEGEDDRMQDTATRDTIIAERRDIGRDFLNLTSEWLASKNEDDSAKALSRRKEVAEELHLNYWKLDPYVRGRNCLDRTGIIQEGGKIEFYPSK